MIDTFVAEIEQLLRTAPKVLAINFHNTPRHRVQEYDAQLRLVAEHFSPAREDDLVAYLSTGHWPNSKPGIIIALYNGYRNNYDVFLPLLEKYGLVGWFLAVSGYASCPPEQQAEFASQRNLRTIPNEYASGRYALSWDELREIDRGHVVGSHTQNHTRVSLDDNAGLRSEIVGSQDDFERELGHKVRAFAWLFGGAYGDNPAADQFVDEAGYEFLLSNFKVQRLPAARRGAGSAAR